MYFQPIKNQDPRLDFYTMHKREATEYDAEHMQKYNEDLSTNLIFVSFLSPAVDQVANYELRLVCSPPSSPTSSPSSSRTPPNDQKPTSGRSSSAPTDPFLPKTLQPLQSGMVPPTEIVTTSDLLQAGLLMSLLATFVAMLGK